MIGSADHAGLSRALDAQREQLSIRATQGDLRLENLDEGDIATVARRFEGLFMSLLVKEMRRTLSTGFFGEAPGSDTFEGWFDEHVGDLIGSTGALDMVGLVKAAQPAASTLLAGGLEIEEAARRPLES